MLSLVSSAGNRRVCDKLDTMILDVSGSPSQLNKGNLRLAVMCGALLWYIWIRYVNNYWHLNLLIDLHFWKSLACILFVFFNKQFLISDLVLRGSSSGWHDYKIGEYS